MVDTVTLIDYGNVTTAQDFFMKINESAGNNLFNSIVFMVTLILFITLSVGFGWESALLTSAFIGLMLSVLLLYAGLVSYYVLGVFVGIIILMILYIIWSNRYD